MLESDMANCGQTETQSVLQHGLSVWSYTKRLISGDFSGMVIPAWFSENHVEIVNNLHDINTIKLYNVYHDCGKPYCIEIDPDGKRHFPNHAEVSFQTFNDYFDNPIAASLIKDDMCLHIETSEQIDAKGWSKKDAFTLLTTALAELHSNAMMFGGVESISFKIKYKKIDQRGKQLCKKFISPIPHTYSYVITRNDLPNAAKCVQSCHSAIELFKGGEFKHSSLICVVVKNEAKLKSVISELSENGINFKIFREPLIGNSITSVCTEPLCDERRNSMKRFQLLC